MIKLVIEDTDLRKKRKRKLSRRNYARELDSVERLILRSLKKLKVGQSFFMPVKDEYSLAKASDAMRQLYDLCKKGKAFISQREANGSELGLRIGRIK